MLSIPARWRTLAILAIALTLACEPAAPPPPVVAAAVSGTARMADTLASLARVALGDLRQNPFHNRERADELERLISQQSGYEALNSRHFLAEERLKAGQNREAIAELERLIRDAGISDSLITPEKKPVFDLLALAYLRLGEQENCLNNPAATVCILPLKDGGRHVHEEGARGAIARYTALLRHYPDDRGAQWLLNIAYLAIGGYPDSVPRWYRIPNLAPRANDPFPQFPNIAGDVGVAITGRAGGVSVDDFNGDGHLDIFTTAWGVTDPVHLFLADGTGRYVDHTPKAGLDGIVGGLNTVHADYDNDGDVDIFVLRGAWLGEAGRHPNSLLRNRGNGTFDDVTFAAGLLSFHPTQTASWADFNRDGYVDLFIGNEVNAKAQGSPSHPSELYVNNRDGTFTEVSAKVGIIIDDFVKAVVWGDVNNDGLPDLFASIHQGRNRLYVNQGGTTIANWRFEERAAAAGVELPLASFPSWFWDYDNDGWEDLLVLGYDVNNVMNEMVAREYLALPRKAEPSRLYRNNGDGTFTDATRATGLEDKVIYAMGSNFGDLDNDGWLDFYLGTGNPAFQSIIPNRMFRSARGRRFDEVTLPGGFGHIQKGHATAFADFDRDGDQDIYMVLGGAYQGDRSTSVLFENPGWRDNAWIALKLEGRAANRSAIGARVEVDVSDSGGSTRTIRRTVNTGGSFGAASLALHVGLGRASQVKALRIAWPDSSRTQTTHAGLAVNTAYHVVQGAAPTALGRPPVPFRKVKLGAPPVEHGHK